MIYVRECFSMLSFRSFMVSCLVFKSLSHFECTFVYGMRVCSGFIDLPVSKGNLNDRWSNKSYVSSFEKNSFEKNFMELIDIVRRS